MFIEKEIWAADNLGFLQRNSGDLKFIIDMKSGKVCVVIMKLLPKYDYYGIQSVNYFDDLESAKLFCENYEIKQKQNEII